MEGEEDPVEVVVLFPETERRQGAQAGEPLPQAEPRSLKGSQLLGRQEVCRWADSIIVPNHGFLQDNPMALWGRDIYF